MNKKGITQLAVWGIIAGVIIAFVFIIAMSKGAFASKQITSGFAVAEGCKPQNVPVSIKGTVFTKDKAWFGVVAEPDKISIEQVTAGGISLRAVSNQQFTWTVKLYDDFTGNLVTSDGGSNTHPGGDILTEDKFSLNFFVPDNNCDDRIDNFEGNIVFEVRTDDGETKAISQKISFVQGRLVR